jgi:ferric-dicitrate binding protein FerR (iron transport regulator)
MDNLQELIKKYIDGRCSPDEAEAVQAWYDSFDGSQSPEQLTDAEQVELRTRLMSHIRANIISLDRRLPVPSVQRYLHRLSWSMAGVAALLILIAGYFFMRTKDPMEFTAVVPSIIKVNNLTKKIQKLNLSDGSILWLSPQSVLEYPRKFSGSRREVKMSGEIFFEISRDKDHPFIVSSGEVLTKVLGTSFRIQAHHDRATEVSVITGKVSVRLENKERSEVFIVANQKAVFMKDKNVLKTDRENTPSMKIWHKTAMNFDNHSVRTVIEKLNKTFLVNIRSSDDKLLDYVLTADFNNQNLPSILEMMSRSLNISYEINERDIVLTLQ